MNNRLILAVIAVALLIAGSDVAAQTKQATQNQNQASQTVKPKFNTLKITLRDGGTLAGVPVNVSDIKINGLYGEATIPFDSIAGIRFGTTASEQTTVQLTNGDSLTGQIDLGQLHIVTNWGEGTINIPTVSHIVLKAKGSWAQNGNRWEIRETQQMHRTRPVSTYRGRN